MISAASLTSKSLRSGPPETLSRIPLAPCCLGSSSHRCIVRGHQLHHPVFPACVFPRTRVPFAAGFRHRNGHRHTRYQKEVQNEFCRPCLPIGRWLACGCDTRQRVKEGSGPRDAIYSIVTRAFTTKGFIICVTPV